MSGKHSTHKDAIGPFQSVPGKGYLKTTHPFLRLFQWGWSLKEDNNGFYFLQIKGINKSNTIASFTMRKIMWTGYSTNERYQQILILFCGIVNGCNLR
ncbi:uncharacterized protein LOC125762399 isoform X2 [Anopheles funestus]